MSVFTSVKKTELESFLKRYDIGRLISYSGIENGITNSNFWLETENGRFVLTLYEHHKNQDLDYILGLQHHLDEQGLACACPVVDIEGYFYSALNGKPAAINRRVEGEVCRRITPYFCKSVGYQLARFHLIGSNYVGKRRNPCGTEWRQRMKSELNEYLKDDEKALLDEELSSFRIFEALDLPRGAVHADLFHDNCLFDGRRFGGFIDFDYACDDFWLYDLAITINDWCRHADGSLENACLQAFFAGYEKLRPLLAIEHDYLPLMLRIAALRFWLSRLYDQAFPASGELTYLKDPNEFKDILLLRRQSALNE